MHLWPLKGINMKLHEGSLVKALLFIFYNWIGNPSEIGICLWCEIGASIPFFIL